MIIIINPILYSGFNFDDHNYLYHYHHYHQPLTCCDDLVRSFRFYAEPILHNKRGSCSRKSKCNILRNSTNQYIPVPELRGAIKYYFADYVCKGGGVPPKSITPFSLKKIRKGNP